MHEANKERNKSVHSQKLCWIRSQANVRSETKLN